MSALWSGYWSVVWFLPAPSHSTYNYADLATEQGPHQTNARAVLSNILSNSPSDSVAKSANNALELTDQGVLTLI